MTKIFAEKKRIVLAVFVLIQLLSVLFCFRGMSGEKEMYSVESQQVQIYGGACLADGTYFIDENTVLMDKVFLSMELPDLKRGVYEVWINYDTNSEQASRVSSEKVGYRRLYSNMVSLRPSNMQKEVSYRFMLWEKIDDLRADILYTGIGALKVTDFKVVHTRQEYSMLLLILFLFFLPADILYYFLIWNREKMPGQAERKILFGLCVIFLFSCTNLLTDYAYSGDDVLFHANRIEGIAREWMSGNFFGVLESYCMYGMGYPMSIMYPGVLLWPSIFCRVLGFDIAFCLKINVIFANLLTTLISYFSFKNIFRDREIGLWGSAIYTLAVYRLYDIYDRAAVGEFAAMTFLPLICWGLTRVFSREKEIAKDKKTVLLLSFGYMGVLYSHVLSLEFVVIFTIVLCVLLWKLFLRKETFLTFVKAAMLAVGLSLWFLLPFLDYSLKANLNVFEAGNPIQILGLYPTQLFWFFPWKGESPYMYVTGMQSVRAYSIGMGLIMVFFCFVYMRVIGVNGKKLQEFKEYPKIKIAAVMSILAMAMSLNLFPWDSISEISEGVQKIVYSIQFPYRFLTMATIALSFLGCCLFAILKSEEKKAHGECFAVAVIFLTILGSSFYLNHEIQRHSWSDFREATAMGSAIIGAGEYLPAETDTSELPYTWTVSGKGILLEGYKKESNHVEFWCENTESLKSYVECNLLFYPGYQAKVRETKETLRIVSGKNNVLRVEIPPGFKGNVEVDFIGKNYWKVGNIISAVLWLGLLCFWLSAYCKRGKFRSITWKTKAEKAGEEGSK